MNDSEEYYCFRVKEGINQLYDKENIVIIPRSYNFDLKKLRIELWKQFGVPKDRRIFYIDDDGDNVPIDSECEFHEALKLAKNAFMVNTAIPLIVGSFHMPMSCSDEQSSGMNESCSNKESKNNDNPISAFTEKGDISIVEPHSEFDKQKHLTRKIPLNQKKLNKKRCDESSELKNNNSISSFIEKNDGSMSESNSEFDKQKHPTRKISLNQKKLDRKRCDKLSEKQIESEDIETSKESNASLRYSDTMPPSWFIEYMETMKKNMVSMITQEVVKNVTEVLNKRFDSLVSPPSKELGQSRNQSYFSLSKRHPRCSFDSNEKNQKKMRSQDEEQSSDASIERVDEPQNVNTTEDLQIKKDMISTISQEVVKEMTEMLNRIPPDPFTSIPSKKHGQSRSQSHLSSSKRFPRHFDSLNEKNQRKMRHQDGEQSSDDASMEHTYELRNANTADVSRQKKLDLIGGAICASMKEEKRKKKYHQWIASVTNDNLNNDVGKEQSQNNTREDFVPRKNLPLHKASTPYDETKGVFENELRMSCSITGNQILDEGRRRDGWCFNSDIDKTSFWSCDQDEEDDDAFEIIQMPTLRSKNESFTHPPEESAAEQRQHDSNRDSPSFELLSESPSPTPTCFMHFNEEHFSANKENPEQQSFQFFDEPTSSIYVIDIHGRIYSESELAKLEHVNADLEKRSGGTYSFITETLPVQDTRCSKSSRPEQRSSEWKRNSRDGCDTCDNASNSYDDVRNSHTSYLTVRTHCDSKTQSQCSCQSQTDSNDFTQSFHSHTTSVTDTTDMYTEAYGNGEHRKYGEQVITKDIREAGTKTTAATATVTATATATASAPRNDHDVRVGGSYMKETWTNERHCHDANNYPECFCAPHSNTSQRTSDPPYQSGRSNGSSDRSSSNIGSRKTSIGETPGTADPVYILPETLVTAAAHVGSFAYDTAREVFDKILAHTREDSVKRRSGARR